MAIRLNGIFKDDMVFQRDKEIRIFGDLSADSMKSDLEVRFVDESNKIVRQAAPSQVYDDGLVLFCLEPLEASGPYIVEVSIDGNIVRSLERVFVGELWVACGQSNMEYPLGRSEGAKFILPKIPETKIHFYNIPVHAQYDEAQAKAEANSEWLVIDKKTCYGMSGVAYYFAKKIEDFFAEDENNKDVHIGIVGCYAGGTSVSCWQSEEALSSTPEGRKLLKDYQETVSSTPENLYNELTDEFEKKSARYYARVDEYLQKYPYSSYLEAEKMVGECPWPPPMGPRCIRRPAGLFETMVLRISPLAIKGVIYYQGEDDCEDYCDEYGAMFKSLINEWREIFWDEELPFLFCQLPMYISKDRKFMGYDDMSWPKLREQQMRVSREVPNTYMAVLTDCGEFDNIHPVDKKTPGERLANLALRFIYGYEDLPAIAPYIIDIRRGEGLELSFGGDFGALKMPTGFALDESGFEVAGDDNNYYSANAFIDFDGRTVILHCHNVEFPTKVRYAYFSYGSATLVGDSGLAAAPFQASVDRGIGNYY